MRPSAVVLLGLLCLSIPSVAAPDVAAPSITGPVTGPGSPSLDSTTFSLAPFGWTEEEFFATGTATAYVNDGPLSVDGRWSVSPGAALGWPCVSRRCTAETGR